MLTPGKTEPWNTMAGSVAVHIFKYIAQFETSLWFKFIFCFSNLADLQRRKRWIKSLRMIRVASSCLQRQEVARISLSSYFFPPEDVERTQAPRPHWQSATARCPHLSLGLMKWARSSVECLDSKICWKLQRLCGKKEEVDSLCSFSRAKFVEK